MDLLLNRQRDTQGYGDMVFINGQTPTTYEYKDSVAQRVYVMLRTFETEWYLNQATGVPYLQRILGKKVSKSGVDNILQQKILGVDGVQSIVYFDSILHNNRVYEVSFKITTAEGDVAIERLEVGV